MALPVLDAVFASSADLPRTQLLSKWLTEQLGSGSIADFSTLPERYLYAKIAVSLGGPRTEQEYIELPKSYAWSDIYGAIIFNRTAPAAPSSLTLTPLTSSSIKLDWVTNGASVAYSVERSVDGAAFQVIGTTAIGATTATNTGLSIASNYQYRIRGSSGGFFTGYSNTASASTYDANASSFIATSGATDIVAINDFVLGVKTLGLWNSMVCWPLRSSQNAGTGTTAYSLGGLGTFNGLMVNGPTYEANGMQFTNASSQYVSFGGTQILGGNSDYTLMGVAQLTNVAAANLTVLSLGNGRGSVVGVASNGSTQIRNAQWTVAGGFAGAQLSNGPTTSMFAGFASGDATNAKNYINSGTPYSTLTDDYRVNPSATTLPQIGANNLAASPNSSNGFWNGLIAASVLWNVKLTDEQVASVFSLYKTTLGTGLSLP